LQDPERNLSNLNRSGIAFTKQQTKVIKELMKTNRVAEAHTMILDIVDESYNKLSQAAAVGFAGSVDTLGESFRDFSEALGKSLIPVVEPAVKALTALLNTLSGEGGKVTAVIAGITLAVKGLSVVIPILKANLLAVGVSAQIATGSLIGTKATLAATSVGFANASVAANAFKVALAKTGIGLAVVGLGFYVTKLLEARNAQKELNEIINEGTTAMINKSIADRTKQIEELEKKLTKVNPLLDALNQTAFFTKGGTSKLGSEKILEDIEKIKKEIKELESGLPAARERDALVQFELQHKNLKKVNEELNEKLQRSKIVGEEKKKEFDLEQKIARIKEQNLKPTEEARLITLTKANHSLNEQIKKVEKINEAAKKQAEIFEKIGDSIATGISDALVDAVMQTKSLADSAKALLNDIARQLMRLGINTLLFNAFGGATGIFKNLDTFAAGGRPTVGQPAIVGEKGPELFVPSSAGTIIPNHSLGGAVTNNIVVNVDANGNAVAQGGEEEGRELGRLIALAVQSEIIQQKRAGGLLA